MAVFRFQIGSLDLLPYIAEGGILWTRSDVEAPDTGRTLDGLMHRGRVATKIRLDITLRPLKTDEAMMILQAIEPVYVTVRYTDPMYGAVVKTMYSNNHPAAAATVYDDGVCLWEGITFPLIER